MPIKVYSYKNCSTCKKAVKFLDQESIKAEVVDITETPPSKTELKKMLASYDGQLKKLFNTSGQVYREMNLSQKLPSMSQDEALGLLSGNGKLVKRPFVLIGNQGVVGFREDEWRELLG